jgi:hypothetical protein
MMESLTGEVSLDARNYTFVYEMGADGSITDAGEPLDGAGDATTPIDGWYVSNGFMGWGW